MYTVPAYMVALIVASVTIAFEMFIFSFAGDLVDGTEVSTSRFVYGLVGTMIFVPFTIFLVAVIVVAIPFAWFQLKYKRLQDSAARNAALVFGVVVAFLGLELAAGIWDRFRDYGDPYDHLRLAGMSIAPGLASGWVFHRIMNTPTRPFSPSSPQGGE